MVDKIVSSLINYENDFIIFQNEISRLRKDYPNKFVALKNGEIISSGNSIEEIKKDLISKNIEPSGTVIEFVSKEEIRVIV